MSVLFWCPEETLKSPNVLPKFKWQMYAICKLQLRTLKYISKVIYHLLLRGKYSYGRKKICFFECKTQKLDDLKIKNNIEYPRVLRRQDTGIAWLPRDRCLGKKNGGRKLVQLWQWFKDRAFVQVKNCLHGFLMNSYRLNVVLHEIEIISKIQRHGSLPKFWLFFLDFPNMSKYENQARKTDTVTNVGLWKIIISLLKQNKIVLPKLVTHKRYKRHWNVIDLTWQTLLEKTLPISADHNCLEPHV